MLRVQSAQAATTIAAIAGQPCWHPTCPLSAASCSPTQILSAWHLKTHSSAHRSFKLHCVSGATTTQRLWWRSLGVLTWRKTRSGWDAWCSWSSCCSWSCCPPSSACHRWASPMCEARRAMDSRQLSTLSSMNSSWAMLHSVDSYLLFIKRFPVIAEHAVACFWSQDDMEGVFASLCFLCGYRPGGRWPCPAYFAARCWQPCVAILSCPFTSPSPQSAPQVLRS